MHCIVAQATVSLHKIPPPSRTEEFAMPHDHPPTTWSVFTKPWREPEIGALGELVAAMGFDAVELPVRPGYQVAPAEVATALPAAVRELGRAGVTIASVASGTDEATFAACAEAGVPFIRIMVPIGPDGYAATGAEFRRSLDVLAQRAERHGVRVAIQPHDALARKRPEHGLELLWPWLGIVNLKSAYFARVEDAVSAHGDPVWEPVFTDARSGMAEWGRALGYLEEHGFAGPICLTAEYTDESDLVAKVTRDLEYARSLQAAAHGAVGASR